MSSGNFRAPIWVGGEATSSSGDLWSNLAAFNEDGPNTPDYTSQQRDLFAADRPVAVPAGPFEFATAQALERWPTIVWDVNSYYAALGVSPRSSRAELRMAYQTKQGWRSPRLTYILGQLLDPDIRAAYDSCRAGDTFFDRYVAEWFHNELIKDSVAKEGRLLTLDERVAKGDEVLDLSQYMNQPYDLLGTMMSGAAGEKGVDSQPPSGVPLTWKWGYYVHNAAWYDIDLLRTWQNALLTVRVQKPPFLTVGLSSAKDAPLVKLVRIGLRTVAFLREDALPTPVHAIACLISPVQQLD